jgi:hypothetical protein
LSTPNMLANAIAKIPSTCPSLNILAPFAPSSGRSVTTAAPPNGGYFKQKHGRVRPVVIVNPSRKCDGDSLREDTGLPRGCGRGLRKFGGDGVASYLLWRLPFRQTPQGAKGTSWHPIWSCHNIRPVLCSLDK